MSRSWVTVIVAVGAWTWALCPLVPPAEGRSAPVRNARATGTKPASQPLATKQEDEAAPAKIAVFKFRGLLPEAPGQFDFGFEMEVQPSFLDIMKRFRKAATDRELDAIVLMFEEPCLGWGQMQELRRLIRDVRGGGREVYCYLEEAGPGIYQLATAASRVCLVPTGEIDLAGIHVEQAYFKNLLDKIGVQADLEHVGAYKEADEPFTRTGPSDEAKAMIEWIARDLYEQMVETVAEGRRMSVEHVRELIDQGPFTAPAALKAGLVDELCYADDLVASLKKRYGEQAEFTHNYGAKETPEIDFSSIFSLFKTFGQMMAKARPEDKDAIAVIYVDGLILPGKTERGLFGGGGVTGSTTVRRVLTQAYRDEHVKAVVLRVDSPGGSATASDIIWHATTQFDDDKPLIVSMGNIAASGGYYVSASAATIFADPGTLTGSIGVLGGKLVTKGLWDWLGVTFHETQFGHNADLFNTNRPFDERQRVLVREHLQTVYAAFTDRVAKGRGPRLKKDLAELAGGRVFTGRQALANGLVDRLGGLSDAIKFAADQAKLSDYEIRPMPEAENFFDALMRGLTGQETDGQDVEVSFRPAGLSWTLQAPGMRDLLGLLRKLDAVRAQSVLRSLLRIELLGRERALLVVPGEITVR